MGGQYPQTAAPQRRLDPDQMPNPIQVMVENQRNCSGTFVTNQPGLVPPLVTTKFITQEEGNSNPRYLRYVKDHLLLEVGFWVMLTTFSSLPLSLETSTLVSHFFLDYYSSNVNCFTTPC